MDSLDVRKTRMDIIFKLIYAFLVVLGALILHLGQGTQDNLLYGHLFLLAVAAFLPILLFAMVRYVFFELSSFKAASVKAEDEKGKIVELAYNDIFICFSTSGSAILLYAILYIALLMCCPDWGSYINPSQTSEVILLIASLLLTILPREVRFPVAWLYRRRRQCCKPDGNTQCCQKRADVPLHLQKIKRFQWAFWSIFVYHMLYLAWFV